MDVVNHHNDHPFLEVDDNCIEVLTCKIFRVNLSDKKF